MEISELTALFRAVARLNADGKLDPDLVQALRRLVAPRRTEAQAVGAQSKDIRRTAPARSADGMTEEDQELKGGETAPFTPTKSDDTARKTKRGRDRGDAEGLVTIQSVLERVTEHADLVPDERRSVPRGHPDGPAEAEAPTAPQPVEALFPPVRVRAILREMATMETPSGRPDLDTSVKLIASGKPIRSMPQELISTLPHSILWLFDAGPSMLPFSRDKQQLARTATRLLGQDRVRIGDYISDPLKGTRPRGEVRWLPLRWPSRSSALVVVSDLGIGGDQPVDACLQSTWWPFLEGARVRGVSTVLLNPYEHDRWPAVAAAFDTALTWDARTGVQSLRRSRRSGKGH